ncbi:acyltransferase ChoActase/COT/CPT, partial [Ramicandelaber brevisporus]
MDQGQDTLPRLPVPTLADTFERYLASVKALSTSDAEYERTAKLVAEFLAPGGRGEQLQERLKRHAAACSSTSWLEDIWNEYAYFSNRESVCFYVNYCFGFRDDNRNQTQLSRAAVMVDAALDFRDAIITRELEPDYLRANPVCMFQYNHLFNCSRYPRKPLDATIKHSYENNHIVVARKGYYFVFDTVHKNTQERLTVPEIYRQLERIIAMADEIEAAAAKGSAPAGKKVGILTTQHRDVWADDRDSLLAVSVANRASLLKLESAVFMLCLDEASPESREEFSRACWHGDGKNRYFDKCFQLIVFKNGRAGFNGEHSLTDGTTSWRLAGHIIRRAENDPVYLPPIEPLKFDADEKVQEALDRAEAKFNEEAAAHQVGVLEFADFGKALIKRWRVSPDAFVQMAIQLAYYRQFGQFKATYESAATKKFAHGRTETVRSVSQESVKWVKAMANYTNSTSDKQASQEKVDMLRKGIETHSKSTLLCVDGRGIDRHMLGLRWMVAKDAGEEMPEVFTDPNFSASCHWTLSTSQISDEIFEEYGWGEVVEDGFGIAYMIKERSLHFNVASKGMGSHDMCWQLGRALRDMYVLFEST